MLLEIWRMRFDRSWRFKRDILWKQHFSWDLGCWFGSVLPHAYKLWNKSVHDFFERDMHFWKYPACSYPTSESVSAPPPTLEGVTFEYYLQRTHPRPIRAWLRFCWPADERWAEMFAHFRSRDVPYKNRCLICHFAMWLLSCRAAAEFPPTELPDCRRSYGCSPAAPAGGALRQSGSSAPSESQGQSYFPPILLNYGRDKPHYECLLVVEVGYQRRQTQSLWFIISSEAS